LRAFLKALKYSRRRDLPECIDIVLAEAAMLDARDLLVILTYLDRGPTAVDRKLLHESLMRLVPERKERVMGWFSQPYFDEGKAEGLAEGKARGEAAGEAKILTRMLEKRFGTIPTAVRQRILDANVATIEAWFERAFDAPDLTSVFDAN
jgi:hypothetical protein